MGITHVSHHVPDLCPNLDASRMAAYGCGLSVLPTVIYQLVLIGLIADNPYLIQRQFRRIACKS